MRYWLNSLLALCVMLHLGGCAGRPSRSPTGTPPPATHAALAAGGEHLVQKGETLAAIARRYGTDYISLARLNDLQPPYTIYPGQRLRVPGGSAAPRGAPPTLPALPILPGGWVWPTAGATVRAYSPGHGGNNGLDIAGQIGQEVRASAGGTVVYVGSGLRQYGNLVIIKHNEDYLSAYGYLERITVAQGATVSANQIIATMGNPGDDRGLLHFEIRYRGTPINPARVLSPPASGR